MTQKRRKGTTEGGPSDAPVSDRVARFAERNYYTPGPLRLKALPPTNIPTILGHGILVVAPDEAIIGLRHERGSDIWEVDTPAGTLKCRTRGLIRFKRFRNRCAYHLKLVLSPRPTRDEWLDILRDALRKMREETGRAEGPR
jgi:hypothetical protein